MTNEVYLGNFSSDISNLFEESRPSLNAGGGGGGGRVSFHKLHQSEHVTFSFKESKTASA